MADNNSPDDAPSQLVVDFFDQFDRAFATFDGGVIAQRYAVPYLACRSDGTSSLFDSYEDTARYFQGLLDDYHALGVRSCGHNQVRTIDISPLHRIGTTTWELCDDAQNIVTSWRESYVLVGDVDSVLVRSSIDH